MPMFRTLSRATHALALVAAATMAVPAAALDSADPAWTGAVWNAAENGNSDEIQRLLSDVPDGASFEPLRQRGDSLLSHLSARETKRAEEREELFTSLREHLAAAQDPENERPSSIEISEALISAVELSMIEPDRDALFADTDMARVIAMASEAAEQAERDGSWILSSELFYRLNVLFEESSRFKPDAERQSRRLGMLRLYVPERFWELRNQRRLDAGDDPLPPYNPYGDHFSQKLDGISKSMLMRAIRRAAEQHVEGVTMREMLRAGLEASKTMAGTPDLSRAFPALADADQRRAFAERLDQIDERLGQPGDRPLGYVELNSVLNGLIRANADTLGMPEAALMHEFGNGAMSALDDFSAIIWPDELRRFQRSTQGSFVGVGIQINYDEQFNIRVVTPMEGTPAQRAGIRSEDVIKGINGESAIGITLDQAVELITGPAGTAVTLTVERDAEEAEAPIQKEIRIVRAEIDLASVSGWEKTGAGDEAWDYMIDGDMGIGYVRLTQFTDDTAADFDRAVAKMRDQGLNGLILDLRYNPGGLLDQAVEISNRFISQGDIVSTEDGNGIRRDVQRARRSRATLTDIPVIVLINENSASASEIVSGAIQDYAHAGDIDALVVGSRSFGKGSVQNVWPLPGNQSAQKLTTQYYKLPAGRLIHRRPGDTDWGVEPDLTVDMLPSQQLESYAIRTNSDTLLLDEFGQVIERDEPVEPASLLNEPTDLQLQTSLVLLQSRVAGENPVRRTMRDEPSSVN
ncbi:MAG: S41 family peptidase [Planctomycetota bacterium]